MGTRAVIARPTDPTDPQKFTGIYVGGDGYPLHTGRAVWRAVNNNFYRNLEAAGRYYIDTHPTGWHSLGAESMRQGECYCHDLGEGEESGWLHTQDQVSDMDYTYILRPEGLEIRRFGRGAGRLAVPWDQERVDWEKVQRVALDL